MAPTPGVYIVFPKRLFEKQMRCLSAAFLCYISTCPKQFRMPLRKSCVKQLLTQVAMAQQYEDGEYEAKQREL